MVNEVTFAIFYLLEESQVLPHTMEIQEGINTNNGIIRGRPRVCLGFPCGSAGKESTCSAGDLGSTPVLGPREFHGLYSPWGHKE